MMVTSPVPLPHRGGCGGSGSLFARASVLLLLTSTATVARAADEQQIRCAGWAGGKVRTLPASAINDGYCDCPHDGSDEPDTGACSGSVDGGWAAVPAASADDDVVPSSSHFQCPQQPNLLLPLSRINDGICDCCDGADEESRSGSTSSSASCPDNCDEILAAERAARDRAAADFATGSRTRSEEMAQFDTMLHETVAEIERLSKTELPRLESEAGVLDAAVKDGKIRYMNGRFAAGKSILDKLADIARVATVEELRTFIVSTCHLAGELTDKLEDDSSNSPGVAVMNKSRNRSTCIPLRLAGLELGFIWEDEDTEREYSATMKRAEVDGTIVPDIADLMIKNAESTDGFVSFGKDDDRDQSSNGHSWSKYDDDDYHGRYDDDEYPYEEDDDEGYRDSTEEDDEDKDSGDESATQSASEDVGAADIEADSTEIRKEAAVKAVSSTRVAASRSPFVTQARSLRDKIDEILKESESNDENDDEDGEGEGEGDENTADADSEEEEQPAFDPQSAQMTRGALDRRLKHVEKGQSFATSAAVLLSALQQTCPDASLKRDMFNLAVMTIYHSQLSSGDVADLFYLTMMGDEDPSSAAQDESCSSIYTALCPPAIETRLDVSLPPQTLVDAAKGRCKDRDPTATTGCSDDSSEIPSHVSDGFSGYFIPKRLGDYDPLRSLFEPLSALSSAVTEVSNLEKAKKSSDSTLSKLRKKIENLEKNIGGRDEHKYGADGELYGIRDSCYAVESGKYEYEVCMFKKATQRDKGQKSGGTHLGTWVGMGRDEESGQRVMKWGKGTKCWNGPARSATVYVTCGAETKLLTADEPSTCEYVFTMESHIACDDDFQKEHGL